MYKKGFSFILTAVFFGAAFLQAAQTFGQICTPAPVGLAAWYQAENNALDSRGGNNGTLQGGASFAAGKVGQAFNLNGTDAFVQAPSSPANDPTTAGSLEAWAYFNQTPSSTHTMEIIGKGGSGTDFDLQADTDNRFRFYIASGTSIASSTNIQIGVWYHVVGTWDSTVGLNIYVNGALENTNGALVTRGQSGQPLEIGNQPTFGPRLFSGLIDEASVYNRALSAAEVQAIYNSGGSGKCKPTATVSPSNQVAWFAGDGDARDLSGSGNDGTLQSGVSYAVGKVGQAFNLNGTANGFIKINASSSLNVGTGSGLTIETWVRPKQISTAQAIVEWNNNSGGNAGVGAHLYLSTTNGTSIPGNIYANLIDTNGSIHTIESAGSLTAANTYQHVAVTYDKTTGAANLFLNGVVVATQNLGSFTPQTSYDLYLGRRISYDDYFYSGELDETAIYNRALTAAEISSIVNADLAGKLKQTTTTNAATIGSATVTFSNAAARTVQQIPLNPGLFPALPAGINTGLVFDLAADVPAGANPAVCFNLPSFTAAQFQNLIVYHFEAGAWVNRTAASNSYPNLCTAGLTSLSPFAIGQYTPTAADVSIGGRVLTAKGQGIRNVSVTLTNTDGTVRTVTTSAFGYYRFTDVSAGVTCIVTARAKSYKFSQPSQIVNVSADVGSLDFTANLR